MSLVVLTWNGKHLLEECFPSVIGAAKNYPGDTEIIVVDNGSLDGSVEYLREKFPQVSVIPLETNTGFQIGSNTGVKAAKYDLVFLLNNDMLLDSNCIAPMVRHFTNEKIFGVGPIMFFPESKHVIYSCSGARFERGLLLEDWAVIGGVDQCGHVTPTLYLSGGAMLFRKKVFEELGLFDTLYHPFNCEDLDICYRAWKAGYYMLFDPASIVYHKHQATIPKVFSSRFYEFINRRNKFLFMWRNLTDSSYLRQHLLYLFPRLLKRTLRGDFIELKAFLLATPRIPSIVKRRRHERNSYVRSDAEICEMLSLKNVLSSENVFELDSEGFG